ncbi:MAG: FecR domain-containing protein [Desulfovibrio sp.]|uniref:FecR domain-containing protein n=1 Tax=Desulfovibrio sp. 7SRBS1 TaxID=3378064 RepID=UPI003B3D116F
MNERLAFLGRILILCLALLAMVFGTTFARAAYELPLSGAATVSYLEGHATLENEGSTALLAKGQDIKAPATVHVENDGKLELLLPEGSVVRFASATDFSLVSATATGTSRHIEVDVAMGDCWASVKDFLGETEFEVNSPTAVAGVAGTKYRLNVGNDDFSRYLVYRGKVRVKRRWTGTAQEGPRVRVAGPERVQGPSRVDVGTWMEIISAGYQFVIRPDGRYDSPKKFNLDQDLKSPWVRWNMERDKELGM